MIEQSHLARRPMLGLLLFAGFTAPRAAWADDGWHAIDVSGITPPLEFSMVSATDGRMVTQADYQGQVVLLSFGYTFCPDVCPLTLTNLATVLGKLGTRADGATVLFATVDPDRDTLPVLKQYTASFGPRFVGLRGSQDALAALARRYRVEYSVTPATAGQPYAVTHSSAIYVFDQAGVARLLIPSFAAENPNIAGTAADLRRLIDNPPHWGLVSRMANFLRHHI